MFRRLSTALVAAAFIMSALAGTTVASAGGGGGNCDSIVPDHWDQGKWANPGGNVAGMQAIIDPANTGSQDECTNPLVANDGVNHTILIAEDNCSGNQCAQISLGAISCDNPLLAWTGKQNGCERNVWHFFFWTVDENGNDVRYDIGSSFTYSGGTVGNPWQPHTYELMFDYAGHRWVAYIDGHYVVSQTVTGGNFDELDITNPNQQVEGGWQSERWDAGDALSYNAGTADYARFSAMYSYHGGGVWWLPHSTGCNYDSEPTTHAHQEYCTGDGFYGQMRTWSRY